MSKMIGRSVSGNTLLCLVDGTQYTVDPSHPNYRKLKDAFNNADGDAFVKNYDVLKAASSQLNSVGSEVGIKVDEYGVTLNGKTLDNSVTKAIMKMMEGGYDFKPLVEFLKRVLKNPSRRSIEELWKFLDVCGLVITDDGCFLAYKSVRENYLDKYSGKFDNRPGAVLRMDRNEVDDDFRNHCSNGFHVGALAYSGPSGWYHNYGDKVIICKVAPEDVVSVPDDHSCQKLRTCAYEVVGDYKAPLNAPVYSGKVGDNYDSVVMSPNDFTDEVSVEDVLVGHTYKFDYVNVDGKDESREGLYLHSLNNGNLQFIMSAGDKSEYQYKSFSPDYMSDIKEVESVSVEVKY